MYLPLLNFLTDLPKKNKEHTLVTKLVFKSIYGIQWSLPLFDEYNSCYTNN